MPANKLYSNSCYYCYSTSEDINWEGSKNVHYKAGTTHFTDAHATDVGLKFMLRVKTHPYAFLFTYFPFWAFWEFPKSSDRTLSEFMLIVQITNVLSIKQASYLLSWIALRNQ